MWCNLKKYSFNWILTIYTIVMLWCPIWNMILILGCWKIRTRKAADTVCIFFFWTFFFSRNFKFFYHSLVYIPHGKRSFEEVRKTFTQILQGLDYIHSIGLIHLDMKFDNVLINDENVVKISDFGLTKNKKNLTSNNFGYTAGIIFWFTIFSHRF